MPRAKAKAPALDFDSVKYEKEMENLRLTRAKADRAKLDFDIKLGKYRRVDDIEYDASETAALVISGLHQLPARLGSACEGLTAAEITARIEKEVAAIVSELRKKAEKQGLIKQVEEDDAENDED